MRIGSDIQSIAALRAKPDLDGNRAIFTHYEREYCAAKADPWSSLGGILCAKEACIKALSGYPDHPRITFLDLEIRHQPSGRPVFTPGARLDPWMKSSGTAIDVSISHSGDYALATVVAYRGDTKVGLTEMTGR